MHTFHAPAPIALVLDVPAGRLQLIAGDRDDVTVEVRPADAARDRDVRAAERIDVGCADGVLKVTAAPLTGARALRDPGSVEVTVQLPAGSRVDAKAALAELRGVGRLGDLAFEGAQATVKVDEAESARLSLQAGDITVGRLRGAAEISTQKGDIDVTEAVGGRVTLRTGHGAVTVGAARDVSASLDAGTGFGRVHNSLRNADGSGAALQIHATTGYGDITARSL
ncbi:MULTISPECIES: DUF4097 family beta strand repeat-containing protein [unclassified Streptomyces]|uniref:DUF4097 family beta strand repeat-containing protein n=1 Tax=unclassified Streptomyces TaxID=2593676 RepID=UPI000749C400|nr:MULTISPECIES: DUF4097 family beta strand repeat-containing protein [unclassified Streptomyces]KUL72117.1 hypothetical protein ADL33_23710 [Streptomyces sp. NRRL WC-3604]KUL75893.1 hypothetical protein ADL34_13190 [Streptomyces sp. NRRL WC-3605]